jgi:calcineurin-like phosphoesterase family protein
MSKTFVTSDTHFDHDRICEFAKRPWANVDEMNEALILKWNAKIQPNDEVFHLGDFSFTRKKERLEELTGRLHGRKYLILGNHDDLFKDGVPAYGFQTVKRYHELKGRHGIPMIVMFHYAQRVWNRSHHGTWQLYGHSHGDLPETLSLAFDVGVDSNNYAPLSMAEITAKMQIKIDRLAALEAAGQRPKLDTDHHGAKR